VELNNQPHKSQLKDKMIKGRGTNMGRVEVESVIDQVKEKTRRKNV
jgi:hypothetical protein